MSGPRVLNKHRDGIPAGAVYIGRGSPWGNPFVIGKDGDRMDVITKFTTMLLNNPELMDRVKKELKGKDLVCFCKPQYCHGDVLLQMANDA